MTYTSVISLIVITIAIFYIDSKIYSWNNKLFLTKYCSDLSLLDTIDRHGYYQDLVEPSIKIHIDQEMINTKRYTIPICFGDIGSDGLTRLLSDTGMNDALDFAENNISSLYDDIILGVDLDARLKKLYIDQGGHLVCIELPGKNIKTYDKVPKIGVIQTLISYNSFNLLSDAASNISNWKYVLSKQDNKISDSITGYHIYLDKPLTVSSILSKSGIARSSLRPEFMYDMVYWLSLTNNEITLYTRYSKTTIGKIKELIYALYI